jgi:hypothetical protein
MDQGWGPTHRDFVATAKPASKASTEKPKVGEEDQTTRSRKKSPQAAMMISVSGNEAKSSFRDTNPHAKFLHRIHRDACGMFSTVLGPEANEQHRIHLHLDL